MVLPFFFLVFLNEEIFSSYCIYYYFLLLKSYLDSLLCECCFDTVHSQSIVFDYVYGTHPSNDLCLSINGNNFFFTLSTTAAQVQNTGIFQRLCKCSVKFLQSLSKIDMGPLRYINKRWPQIHKVQPEDY